MRFFRSVKRFFMRMIGGSAEVQHSESYPQKPITPTDRVLMQDSKIAFVVGHNKRAQGAQSFTWYDGEGNPVSVSEFEYWSKRFSVIQKRLHEEKSIYVPIIFRPERGGYSHECDTVAEEVKKANIKHTIHGHFNSASYLVLGAECLIPKTSTPIDNAVADYLTDLLNRDLGFKERGRDGVKEVSSSHRGSKMLYKCKRAGTLSSIIFEPCFGNVANKESKILFQQPERIDSVIFNTVVAIVEGKIKDLDA